MARSDKGTKRIFTVMYDAIVALQKSLTGLSAEDKAALTHVKKMLKSADARRKFYLDPSKAK